MEKFTSYFIKRPVAASLMTLAIVLVGILGYRFLPVSPLPQIDFPTISVRASVPGASPDVMAATVATPLERNLGNIAGVSEITSSSSEGSTNVTLQFDLSRDINSAANDVQAALNATRSSLPAAMRNNPTYRKVNPSDAPIAILALQSDQMSQGQLYDLASNILLQRLLQIPGVGDVNVGGSAPQAVRVEMNPEQLAAQGVTLSSVVSAINNANTNQEQGDIVSDKQHWQIKSNAKAQHANDFLPLVISYNTTTGAAVRLQDVATVSDTVQNPFNMGMVNSKPAVLLVITRSPDANIIETVDRVRASMTQLKSLIPENVSFNMVMDRTPTIRASISDVERSLIVSLLLVILVVYFFLKRWRAILIPSVVIPVSLIGTFAIMYASGFSLNNLSLMALTIATGFVVDDAIVVLENISRHIEEGETPLQAAIHGSHQIGFTVLSMSISLVAVFIPFLAMNDLVGRLFREFALTLTIAIIISMILSLTVTPMMCARGLRADDGSSRDNRVIRWFSGFLKKMEAAYARRLAWALSHSRLMLVVLFAAIGVTAYLFVILPKGLFPQQDTGSVQGMIQSDQSSSFEYNRDQLLKVMDIVNKDDSVASVSGFVSGSTARMFITLKPLGVRKDDMNTTLNRLRGKTSNIPGARVLFNPTQDLRIGGRQSAAAYQYTLQSDSSQDLNAWAPKLTQALIALPQFKDVNSDLQNNGIDTQITYDREAMVRLGLTVKSVNDVLYAAFGPRTVGTIYDPLSTRSVLLSIPLTMSEDPSSLDHIFVLNSAGKSIPLSAFATWSTGKSPTTINHQGSTAAGTISFNLAANATLSEAQALIEQTRLKIGMPDSVRGGMQGTAKAFEQNQHQQLILLGIVLICVYIVLGVLYESFIHPLTILSTIPTASLGALLALWITNIQFDLIGFIGILLLIGIVKKNAIMMIDYALRAQREGMSAIDAISRACRLRFRPILMTTIAAIFGAIPLALGQGNGAELRQPLGIAIVGGLLMSQLLTLFTTPVIFIYFDRLINKINSIKARRKTIKQEFI